VGAPAAGRRGRPELSITITSSPSLANNDDEGKLFLGRHRHRPSRLVGRDFLRMLLPPLLSLVLPLFCGQPQIDLIGSTPPISSLSSFGHARGVLS